MIKKFFLMVALLLTVGLSVQGVAAQVAENDFSDIPGMESAYTRTYAPDMEALMASPTADGLDLSAYMRNASIMAYTFDSDKNAEAFIDMAVTAYDDTQIEMAEAEVSELTELDVDGIKVTMEMADLGISMTVLMFVDGDIVFTVMVMDSSIDASTAMALDLATYVLDTEATDAEVTLNKDGTSTGGAFDRMPVNGNEILQGLTISSDGDMMSEIPAQ